MTRSPTIATESPTPAAPIHVAQLAKERLRQIDYLALEQVTCEYHDGVARLRGSVSSFYLKQVAQVVVGKLDRVERVVNQIEVRYDSAQAEQDRWR